MPTPSTDAAMLARLRVSAATGQIAPEVAAWALRSLEASPRLALAHRNALLIEAANAFDGSLKDRADTIAATVVRIRVGAVKPAPRSPAALVMAADAIAPCPTSARQVLRILMA